MSVVDVSEDESLSQSSVDPQRLASPRPRSAPSKPPAKKPKPCALLVLAIAAVVAACIAIPWAIHANHYESTDDAFVEGRVIPISPQLPARVVAVPVEDNELVHAGDLLVELDPTDYQVALDQAHASESAAVGQLQQATAQIAVVKAQVQERQAELDVAQASAANVTSDYNRWRTLETKSPQAVSKQQLDDMGESQSSSAAQVEQAKAKLTEAQAQIETAQANIVAAQGELAKAQADVHRAEVNLSYCKITAPEDGRITKKNVEAGSYVQSGQNLLAIVPPDVWVVANFKETQLARMRVGQSVRITIDAYPDRQFTGKVDSIQSGTGSRFSMLPAENATGNFVHVVQRLPVKVTFDPGQISTTDQPLAPGMSAEPEVYVAQ